MKNVLSKSFSVSIKFSVIIIPLILIRILWDTFTKESAPLQTYFYLFLRTLTGGFVFFLLLFLIKNLVRHHE
ncbi:hypothetical protein AWJ15_09615 [Lacticaseibacillus rhamnosus]|nr:hypothetical protein AWJ15_09615 [Lacticaseibacillus rhamnosus]